MCPLFFFAQVKHEMDLLAQHQIFSPSSPSIHILSTIPGYIRLV
ncbi:hypothetical protein TC41_1923 [Alicyclobacillus acidocaldarius subsp. acidocaldarius Tc-4-1]|uniref:Uncharacterized protein n=1 Tax=Alicyclobacillus acidocaldarius (strain Tc-4-1) TaxID=1048834 RepID=F8IDI5_ALIAT|nr:hypothetical protein TC41_1923 [Alicyclobacillus acidocaldarius subsp. acidocaldarius Tc-4-1]